MDQAAQGPVYSRELSAESLRNCRVLPDRETLFTSLPQGKSWCEVGVGVGDSSKAILEKCKVTMFYAIDMFSLHEAPVSLDGEVGHEKEWTKRVHYYRERFKPQIESGVMEILTGDRVEMLKRLPQSGVSIFYVCDNNNYQSLRNELSVIGGRIADDGIIIISDYIMADWMTGKKLGVVQAANEFMIQEKWEMIYFALHEGMFCDIAIRRL